MAQAYHIVAAILLRQRGYLFPWSPVLLAVGIGAYFTLRAEPDVWILIALGLSGTAIIAFQGRAGPVFGPIMAAVGLVALGFSLAGARAHMVSGPVLDFRYYGPIEGRIVGIDRSGSDAVRLTLDRVVLQRMDPDEIPKRVRVSLHGKQGFIDPEPGATIILTGHLSPPGGAVEPGGFDFRRHAWFLKLGGVGYTRSPVLLLDPPGQGQVLFKARMWLSKRVQNLLPGETGAFAAALMTGDRSGMGQDTLRTLRETNLAHLLAISGLHMGLLAGFVFAALRVGLLLIPRARHNWPVKKLAAAGALLAALGYLSLSGGSVATQRAFIMAAAALTATMLDRRALSLRSVAMAALVVLMLRPEALVSPGFQMSFAATTALITVFEQITLWQQGRQMPRWFAPVMGLVVSSAVAGAATAPVGMAHFNMLSQYGLVANLLSVPVMGLVVVPMAVLAALLMPFGLDWIALNLMALGLDWILGVAQWVASWEGVTRAVIAPDGRVLPLLAIGGLILCLWRGTGRLVGLAPAALAVFLWMGTERPALLISDTGTLVGVMTDHGRALSRPKGSGFVAENWLENDGFAGSQRDAAGRWPGSIEARVARAQIGAKEVIHLQGKRAVATLELCSAGQIVVASANAQPNGACDVFDPARLRYTGSVAFWAEDDGWRMVTDRQTSGIRLWHGAKQEPLRLAKKAQ
ncbi:ComEC/Rec2 family competence protein [uncultured Pelagimonas sp.]|uniref:ComEC/Rec2 family competence protein n=1 Tax=uncultured Pelagimonas sp. TaxID=1618102 RepID=UPI00261AD6B2|nr:ComEC/Rec2 family competence protein [uncultured Pelagimonas sp.]